ATLLGSETPGVWDAVRGTPETGGTPKGGGGAWPTRFVSAELTLLRGGEAGALFGFFPLDQQLVQCVLELTPDRRELARLRLDCQCDGQLVPPREIATSQWVLVQLTADVLEAAARYAERLLRAHPGAEEKHRQRKRPPTVWCSWYYYGDGFCQAEAEANLESLRARPLPVDVFQIDECWDQVWGDWFPNIRWPDVAHFARRIRAAGYRPGIWTCPLLADYRSTTRYHHPEWLLKKRNGEHVIFPMGPHRSFVLDPTHPEVLRFLEALFHRLTHEWGYTYHKLDFTRAVGDPDALFYDRTKNRAQAYRMALEAVRRGAGPHAYINVCGGFYGPLIGLADAQRTGSDVKSEWPQPPAGEEAWGYGPFTIKQNTLRFWMNSLWDNDPDALMVRRRPTPYREEVLSLGRLNDDEALTSALNQYLGGGLVCFTENLAEVEADRLLLLRHCAPSIGCAAIPRDAVTGCRFPSLFHTAVTPAAPGLPAWHTLSLVNWYSEPRTLPVTLAPHTLGPFATQHEVFLVSAFRGRWVRSVRRGESLLVGPIPPHGCEVLKVQPCPDAQPCILRTDGHFSMGGVEISAWEARCDGLRLEVWWPWPTALEVVLGPPSGRRFRGGEPDGTYRLVVDRPLPMPKEVCVAYA
ncbi:MAG: alpha-galactosidase, partial [Armatimonadota bacterium]|nr:alpha-galactosidase [Armatimonadota bacterium]